MNALKDAVEFLNATGFVGLFAVVLYGGFRCWWVYGHIYRKMEERALRAESLNERAILVAHQLLVNAEQEDHR